MMEGKQETQNKETAEQTYLGNASADADEDKVPKGKVSKIFAGACVRSVI
jgi:hypothetical protein